VTLACRFLDAADVDAFYGLRMRALAEHPEAFHSAPEDWEKAPPKAVLARLTENRCAGAFADGELVGMAMLALTARYQAKRRHRAEVWSVYVAPEHRRGGTAHRLVSMLIEEARRLGLEGLVLTVAASNPGAAALYEGLGFVRYGLEPGALHLPDGTKVDDVLMLKRL